MVHKFMLREVRCHKKVSFDIGLNVTHRPPILFVTSKMDTERVYKLLKQHYSDVKIVSLERITYTDYVINNTVLRYSKEFYIRQCENLLWS